MKFTLRIEFELTKISNVTTGRDRASSCCSAKLANAWAESEFGQTNHSEQSEQHETHETDW